MLRSVELSPNSEVPTVAQGRHFSQQGVLELHFQSNDLQHHVDSENGQRFVAEAR